MKQVILTKGLPASGKTTWAKTQLQDNPGMYKRICKDDLRDMLDNGCWSSHNEKFILQVRDEMIIKSLANGKHVIIDDTNLHPKHEERISQVIKAWNKSKDDNVQVKIQDFTDIDYQQCIERDQQRQNPVGAKVIRNMFWKYIFPPDPVERTQGLPQAIICDIDGTLALMGDRSPYDASEAHKVDRVNASVRNIVTYYATERYYRVFFLSGRSDAYRSQTVKFIENAFTGYDFYWELYMRPKDDSRKDYIVKKELFDNHIRNQYNVMLVLDDRNQVVDLWRKCLNLPCFQVAEGDF